MASVWEELKRRNVVKVAVAYSIVAWILIEVASVLGPALKLPESATTFVVFLLILGFPVAMLLTWAYELTPDGMKKTHTVPMSESITKVTGRKLDFGIIALLVVALVFVVYNYVLVDEPDAVAELPVTRPLEAANSESGSVPPVAEEKRTDVLPYSIAVLPLDNLSPDPEHAYFAEGLHDAIISQLARVAALNVIGRTSVLRFANVTRPMSEIAEELRVETLLEGSVRYAGDRIRVTAQLIDGETETHLWVEEYEGDLADVFGIQTTIASNIAAALEAELTPAERDRMDDKITTSPEATALYYKAFTSSGTAYILTPRGAGTGIPFIEEALAEDPGFALAHALKAEFLAVLGEDDEAFESATRALELDPNLPEAYAALGRVHERSWRGGAARAAYESALKLSPKRVRFLQVYSRLNGVLGQYDAAIDLAQKSVNLDTGNVFANNDLFIAYSFAGDAEAVHGVALSIMELAPFASLSFRAVGHAETMLGNVEEARHSLLLGERLGPDAGEAIRLAYALRIAGFGEDALRLLPEKISLPNPQMIEYHLAQGDEAAALRELSDAIENRDSADFPLLRVRANIWQDPVLNQPEFRALRDQLVFEE